MAIMRGDQKKPGCDVPIFQLIQWKYAIRLEMAGLRFKGGRSVAMHAKIKLGLPLNLKKEQVIEEIIKILNTPDLEDMPCNGTVH